jgi:hypothetical protein
MANQRVDVRLRASGEFDATSSRRRSAALGVAVVAALVAVSLGWALVLVRTGVDLHLSGGPPLTGRYDPRLPATAVLPALFAVVALGLLPMAANRLRWCWLLGAVVVSSGVWAVLLAVVDGVSALGAPLASPFEYLRDVPRVDDLGGFLATFTAHVAEDSADFHWTTHVGGHPPLAFLAFVMLGRLGLGGPGPAAALCIVAGASAAAAVLITVRSLGGEQLARRATPFVALSPLALWIATSADALFCGVVAWGLCCLAVAAGRNGWASDGFAVLGGLLLGLGLFLSYGLCLMVFLAVSVVAIRRRLRPLVVGAVGVAAVIGVFAALGFWWLDGLAATVSRVRDGAAWQDRPSTYFVVANLAAVAIAVGPAVVAGIAVVVRTRANPWWSGVLGRAVVLPAAAIVAVLLAGVSNLSKGEVERIYLPFAVWLLPAAAALPVRDHRRWLAAQLVLALIVQIGWRLRW